MKVAAGQSAGVALGATLGATLGELAVRFGCSLRGDPDHRVTHVANLERATPQAVAFIANTKYRRFLPTTRAGAVILESALANECPVATLLAKNPYATYARIAEVLHPKPAAHAGVHASAVVDASATIDPSAAVGPQCVIGANVRIGARVQLGPGCVVLEDAAIGDDTRLIARVTICAPARIGARCILHPGVVIGSDGFGNAMDAGRWVKVPQLGGVVIGDDVEIGANTTVDRGAIDDTVIEEGVRLDNQIQIGHNVRIGAHTAMAAFVGVAGSTTIGKYCMLAGKVGVAGQLEICDRVIVIGHSTVAASITEPGTYSSTLGLQKAGEFRRNAVRFRQLDTMAKSLQRLTGEADDNSNNS